MPKSIEAHGVTIDEAIQNALNTLGLGRDSVEIEILHHPRGGFLGIGARRAKVRATEREQVLRDGEEFDMAPGEGGRGRRRRRSGRRRSGRAGDSRGSGGAGEGEPRRNGGESRRSQGREAEPKSADASERSQQPSRSEGRGRRGSKPRGGDGRRGAEGRQQRERRNDQGRKASSAEAAAAKPRQDEAAGERRGEARDRRRGGSPTPRPDPETLRTRATEVTQELMSRMGYAATVEVNVVEGSVDVSIVTSEGGDLLIGRRGTTLDALEHLVNRMVSGPDPASRVRVNLNVDGYRQRRSIALAGVAERMKQHVLATARRAQVTPLSPADRVVFQEVLAGDDAVSTRVLGSGFYRRVLVSPRDQQGPSGPAAEFTDEGHLLSAGDDGSGSREPENEPLTAADAAPDPEGDRTETEAESEDRARDGGPSSDGTA
jgi:spoIIIJ-associated protein